ncbi:MAG: L-histidine N(alpha)-methyltransferase [Verrucomicrobia bacterium]|nr:L-histidine N(alpha)-methyltransferase [Verrucomicrobiota bacterium]MDE3099836.1 L-histidine N(alpha)-methyltransferase [Verrucomicrobiota bacterium]
MKLRSPSAASVTIHPSQFPETVRRDLLKSLRSHAIAPKFHYDTFRQAQKWLALHDSCSPSRHDAHCRAIYENCFRTVASQIHSSQVHLIGLGCGGGQKEARLLRLLKARGHKTFYTPCDASVPLVLAARRAALSILPAGNCFPLVCDLGTAGHLLMLRDLPTASPMPRLVTFFGMMPNFEPNRILPKLASLLRRNDFLLVSANLAPARDYDAGMKAILPQYRNAQTRDWLMTFLLDVGFRQTDGKLIFSIENGAMDLKRIVARFHFSRNSEIHVHDKSFAFRASESLRVFFSYRHTPERLRRLLSRYNLQTCFQWIAQSAEEAVLLCHSSVGPSR